MADSKNDKRKKTTRPLPPLKEQSAISATNDRSPDESQVEDPPPGGGQDPGEELGRTRPTTSNI